MAAHNCLTPSLLKHPLLASSSTAYTSYTYRQNTQTQKVKQIWNSNWRPAIQTLGRLRQESWSLRLPYLQSKTIPKPKYEKQSYIATWENTHYAAWQKQLKKCLLWLKVWLWWRKAWRQPEAAGRTASTQEAKMDAGTRVKSGTSICRGIPYPYLG